MKKALGGLEADPDWTRLLDEDREEIADKLTCDMPETPENKDSVTLLQTLLVRKRTLAGLIAELREEVKRRCPVEPEPEPEPGEGEDARKSFKEEVFEPGDLFGTVLISLKEDLDSWLAGIRGKLTELLEAGKRVKVVGGDK